MVATAGPNASIKNLCNKAIFGSTLFQANRNSRRHRPMTTASCKPRIHGFVILFVFVFFLALHVSLFLSAGPNLKNVHHSDIHNPSIKKTSLDAIVTVAMCGYDAREMVQSLRSAGEWTGPIYVLTDAPHAEDPVQCTPIDVRGNHPTFLNNPNEFQDYKTALDRWNALYSKWHKTQIFQLIPESVQTVLFMDADMLAQRSLTESSWLGQVESLIADPSCELITYPERWYTTVPILGGKNKTVTGRYHSGFMILKRHQSAPLLEAWSRLMVHQEFMDRDQGKLTQAIESLQTKVCWQPNRWRHMQIGADNIDNLWFHLTTKGTFYHVASSKSKMRNGKSKGWSSPISSNSWGDKYDRNCNYTWPK
jgi:hypothetical protein